MASQIALPDSLEGLNEAWFTMALAQNYPGTEVTKVTHGSIIHGTATKLRVLLDYNDAGHAHRLPPSMWYKGGLEAHSATATMQAVYAAEASFYRDFAPQLDLTLPHCHFVHYDEATGISAMLLEDMLARNVRFGYATRPASPKLAASVLSQLAKLHAAFWNDSALANTPLLAEGGARLADFVCAHNFSPDYWSRALTLPRGELATGAIADLDRMAPLMQRMLAQDRATGGCLVHGDLHLGNICILPGDEAAFLDWQAVMRGFWAHDVGYFLPAALTIADRRAHERDLVAHYAAALRAQGIALDDATAWREYRRHVLYGLCWLPCPPEWVPEAVAYANTERTVTAMLDLQTVESWEQD